MIQNIQVRILEDFIDYTNKQLFAEGYISTRTVINDFVQKKQIDADDREVLSNFLKKSIIETGFVDKYIDNISVYITLKNKKDLEKGLLRIREQLAQNSVWIQRKNQNN